MDLTFAAWFIWPIASFIVFVSTVLFLSLSVRSRKEIFLCCFIALGVIVGFPAWMIHRSQDLTVEDLGPGKYRVLYTNAREIPQEYDGYAKEEDYQLFAIVRAIGDKPGRSTKVILAKRLPLGCFQIDERRQIWGGCPAGMESEDELASL